MMASHFASASARPKNSPSGSAALSIAFLLSVLLAALTQLNEGQVDAAL